MFSKEYIFKIEFERVSEVFCSLFFQSLTILLAANLKCGWSKSSSWNPQQFWSSKLIYVSKLEQKVVENPFPDSFNVSFKL